MLPLSSSPAPLTPQGGQYRVEGPLPCPPLHRPQAGLLALRAHGGPCFAVTPSAMEKELTPGHGCGLGAPMSLAVAVLPCCSHPGARQAGPVAPPRGMGPAERSGKGLRPSSHSGPLSTPIQASHPLVGFSGSLEKYKGLSGSHMGWGGVGGWGGRCTQIESQSGTGQSRDQGNALLCCPGPQSGPAPRVAIPQRKGHRVTAFSTGRGQRPGPGGPRGPPRLGPAVYVPPGPAGPQTLAQVS